MQNQPTPKTNAFRILVQKTVALYAEIFTLDTAIRERDVIRALMADCGDETQARKHLGDLMRAEETVTVKQVRLPRQQSELVALLEETQEAYNVAHTELSRILEAAPKHAAEAFRELLHASQYDPEIQKVEKANPVVVAAIRPLALAELLDDRLRDAWRAANITGDLASKKVEGFQNALKWIDKVLSGHAEVMAEDKRMTDACEAFRKVLAKG